MTFNLKQANEDKFPMIINGKMLQLNSAQIDHLIKKKMKGDLAVQKMFEKFEVSLDQLDNLHIEVGDLNGIYAETDLKSMVLDKELFEDGRFFSQNYFICVHELSHFCSRVRENNAYFSDPEEVLGFVGSVASLMASGSDLDEIFNLVYPKISFHFHNEEDSREFMAHCIYKAKELLG